MAGKRSPEQPVLSFSNTVSGEITLVEYVVSLDKLGVHDVEHVGARTHPSAR